MMLPWTQIYYVYVQQKTCYYHYYQYIRSTETNLFHEERLFNMKSSCGLQIRFTARTLPFGLRKRSVLETTSLSFGRVYVVIIIAIHFIFIQGKKGSLKISSFC